ncbi:hypothetical protein RFI_06274, partial [Reticulomyxa filosa]
IVRIANDITLKEEEMLFENSALQSNDNEKDYRSKQFVYKKKKMFKKSLQTDKTIKKSFVPNVQEIDNISELNDKRSNFKRELPLIE